MSGTLNTTYDNVIFALHLNSEAMARLQEQAATGSQVNRTSDDPSVSYRVLGLNSQIASLQNYTDNLSEAMSILELSSAVIVDMLSHFTDTKASLTQIISGTYGEDARDRAAEGVDQTLEQIVLLANSEQMDQYLFGGGNTASAPYLVQRTDGEITTVTYQGSYEDRNIEVAPNVKTSALHVGKDIFQSDDRGEPVFLGDTGAAAGTGTSSSRADTWLTVTGSAGNYNLSIDDGLSTVNTDGTDTNLAVTNSTTGEVLYVDTTAITGTGVELVRMPGTYDIFTTLITLRDTLENDRNLSDGQVREILDDAMNSLDEMSDLLVRAEVSIGSKIGFLDDLKDSLRNIEYFTEDETTRLQEADIAQVAIDLSRREALYQISLSVAVRLMSVSLMDFLR
ncbi:MAG: flagellar hook-associated protein 3 [Planctomycetes bacterium B3_Pla]|nr:MAG: flagellar hook-associated protein 3 [Planctomycetes bacterium B3_Pla]